MKLIIKNGRVIDPATNTDTVADILVEDETIVKVEKEIKDKADKTINAKGCFVMPGFIDMHVHLRDPGFEKKETIETGANAAARGGYTTILAMPNTKPVVDNPDVVNYVHNKAKNLAPVHVLQIGAITKGQQGKELADIEGMVAAGIPAISEDGKSVMDAGIYRDAMLIAKKCNIPVLAHCEDINLVHGGVMNAGKRAQELGLPGIENYVEDIIAARDTMLANGTKAAIHLCHVSTTNSCELLEQAKAGGVNVTAEACPHHFTLCEDDIPGDDSNYKMNPPLRTREDMEAIRQALKDGVIDVIATDHAPHTFDEKNVSMRYAPFGIVGLETAAALTYTELVQEGYLTEMQMVEKMSYNPAKILGLKAGSLAVGMPADIVIFNPKKTYQIDPEKFASKARNTPFGGRTVTGMVETTIVSGTIVYEEHS